MRTTEYTTVHVDHVVARTDKAVLCSFDGKEVWVPLSQIDGEEDFESGPIDVAAWFAEREELQPADGDDAARPSAGRSVSAGSPRPRSRIPDSDLGPVTTAAFGRGRLIRVEGEKSVVKFPDGKVRTLGSRYVKPG
jgi:hypothetical protein